MLKAVVIKAYNFSEKAHEGVERKFSGLPYFTHPKFVARTIEHLTKDATLIAAGFLHDVIEDTDTMYDELVVEFGREVANLVQEVTSDGDEMKLMGGKRIYMAIKVLNMSERALIIKLADRYHNVLFLESDTTPLSFITKYYKETRFVLDELTAGRELNNIHEALIKRIEAILAFLKIRYDF